MRSALHLPQTTLRPANVRPWTLVAVLAAACTAPTQPDERVPVGEEDTQGPDDDVDDSGKDTQEPDGDDDDSGKDTQEPDDDGDCDSLPMFLLAGQSNMEGNTDATLFTLLLDELGQGSDDDLQDRLIAALRYWYFRVDDGYASYGYTNELAAFEVEQLIAYRSQGLMGADLTTPHADTYCSFNDTPIAPLELNCGYPFGPELMVGHMRAASGHPTTSLVKMARGGTTLFTDWRSPTSGGEVGPDYLQLQDRIASLTTDPLGVHPACAAEACHWAAFIWFQGENDSFEEGHAAAYEANLKNLLADVRAEVGDPVLPVIVVQTGSWAQSLEFGPDVAAAQQRVVDEDMYAQLVVTDDLSGYYHYDPAAQLIIGQRIADALQNALECDDQ